jgi:hypothetical protein
VAELRGWQWCGDTRNCFCYATTVHERLSEAWKEWRVEQRARLRPALMARSERGHRPRPPVIGRHAASGRWSKAGA